MSDPFEPGHDRSPEALVEQAEEAARRGAPLRAGEALPAHTSRLIPSPAQLITAIALASALFAAPFLADAALARFGTRIVAAAALGFALAVLVVRFLATCELLRLLREAIGPLLLLGMAWTTGEAKWLLFVPALVNLMLAIVFARSALSQDEGTISVVERGARFMQPYLPDFTANYCRVLTLFWASWFGAFAVAIAWTAIGGDRADWRFVSTTLYFGGIFAVSLVEFVHRKIWFRNYGPGPARPALPALLPLRGHLARPSLA